MLPAPVEAPAVTGSEAIFEAIAGLVALGGIYLTYLLFMRARGFVERMNRASLGALTAHYLYSGWGFDWLYERVFVRPFLWFCRVDRNDFIDSFYDGIALWSRQCYLALSSTESGRVRWYAAGIVFGSIVLVTLVVFL